MLRPGSLGSHRMRINTKNGRTQMYIPLWLGLASLVGVEHERPALPVQPGLHPPQPLEKGLQVLTVHLPIRDRSASEAHWDGSRSWNGLPQQGALPPYRQGQMFPVHHLPLPTQTHGADLSTKKSQLHFELADSWYNRATRRRLS